MTPDKVLTCICLLLCGVLFHGCAGFGTFGGRRAQAPPLSYKAGDKPLFYVRYLPYPTHKDRVSAPVPDYRGWTEERMERDLKRMAAIGLDGVVLQLRADVFSDSFRSDRVRRFIHFAGTLETSPLRVVLQLVPDGESSFTVSPEQIALWMMVDDTYRLASMWRPSGRATMLVDRRIRVSGAPHPACALVRSGPEEDWITPQRVSDPRPRPRGRFRMVTVFAGWRGEAPAVDARGRSLWTLPRQHGKTLRAELWQAFAETPALIVISSWNDFVNGDFIEPNALDGEAAAATLAAEITRVRQACSSKPMSVNMP